MTPAVRASALLLAVAAFGVAFVICAAVARRLAVREPVSRPARPRHLRPARGHRAPRHEWLLWTVSVVVRFYRDEDGGAKTGVLFAVLFLAFSVVIGANA